MGDLRFGFDMFVFDFDVLLLWCMLDLLVVRGLVSIYLCCVLFGFGWFLGLLTYLRVCFGCFSFCGCWLLIVLLLQVLCGVVCLIADVCAWV